MRRIRPRVAIGGDIAELEGHAAADVSAADSGSAPSWGAPEVSAAVAEVDLDPRPQ
jgi:hypothetical protein